MNKYMNAGAINNIVSGSKNKIINGDMVIDQRNSGAVQSAITSSMYTIDRWMYGTNVSGKFNCQQNAGSITPPVGFINYLGVTVASAYTALVGDSFWITQKIEGLNCRDLAWGTINAKPVTLQFQVYSSIAGTHSGSILNGAGTRSYPFSYTIFTANTWTPIIVTIPGDTSGTWLTNTGNGMYLLFNIGSGVSNLGAAGSWQSANCVGTTGSVSIVGTAGATFYITGVQLEVGKVATSFEYLQYGLQLALCQRYFERLKVTPSTVNYLQTSYKATKRAAPTATLWSGSFNGAIYNIFTSNDAIRQDNPATTTTDAILSIDAEL